MTQLDPGRRAPTPVERVRHPDMRLVPAGVLLQGSAEFYLEERPVHEVRVGATWVDRSPVTNRMFRRFVRATGYVTLAERVPAAADLPDGEDLVPGSLVFRPTRRVVDVGDSRQWWERVPDASWWRPGGPGTDLRGRLQHPVTHVALEDAEAYAAWVRRRLLTEAEWEWAARGGLRGATYAWGDELMPGGRAMANTWHGRFPWRVQRSGGPGTTTAVGTYPGNGYGLFDMTGNVWEWTSTPWTVSHDAPATAEEPHVCCAVSASVAAAGTTGRTIKGGSHLCAPSYCHRYRPAARQGQSVHVSTSHLGFRCAVDP